MVLNGLLICLSSVLTAVHGSPEAPLPYYYSVPRLGQNSLSKTGTTSYIPPANSYNNVQQQNYNNIIPDSSYGTPILRTTNIGQNIRNYGTPDLLPSNQAPIGAYRSQPEPLVNIQKHIYVHVAPPDVEEETRQRIQQQSARQKHYKIIFVKVPEYPAAAQYVAQQQALQQEKTLIYVLVKKPEDLLPARANQVATSPVNKPEVYFIKYKAKSEQAGAIGGQTEPVQGIDDTVVIEGAARGASSQSQGYNYDRPGGILK